MTRRFLVILPLVLTFVVLGARVPLTFATPNVDATKVDVLTDDINADGKADPGDTLTYVITISNTGDMDATDVLFSDLIDFNTTLVPGSLQTTPLARDDEYATTGNVSMTVVAAQGVLANDDDPDGDTLTIISVQGAAANIGIATATFHGGSVTLSLDGGFTYNPPVGFEGLDTFAYVLEDDDNNTDSAAVFIAVTDMIWFVDAANTTCSPACDGRLGSPFNCLVGTGCFDPVAMDDPGDIIFVDAGAYTGGLTLLDSQQLIGDGSSDDLAAVTGITVSPDSDSLPSFTGTNPNVTSSGDTVIVGQNNTIRGLTLTNTDGTGIRGTSVGTLVVIETTIVGGGGMSINGGVLDVSLQALSANSTSDEGISLTAVSGTFSISDPSGTITVDGHAAVDILGTGTGLLVTAEFASLTSTNSAGRGIRLTNLTSGSSFHGGLASVTASTVDGLVLNNNTGSAFTFADMDIDNSSTNQRAIFASTTGTLTIAAGDIDGGSGRGVDIDGTHLNVTLDSVTSIGGTTAGIDLNSTTGTFAVIGDGTDTSVGGNASGGTISNKTGSDGSNNGIGILLNNAHSVSLARMQLNDFTNFAIKGDTVTGFNLTNSTIDGANGNSLAADEGSITLENLLGTSTITDSEISGGHQCNVLVDNSSSTLMSLTITGTTIGTTGPNGQDGMLFRGTSSADMTLDISNSFFTAAPGDLLNTTVLDTATMDVTLNNIAFSNNHTSIASAGGGVTIAGGGSGSAVTFTYDITNNTFRDAKGIAVNLFKGTGAGSFSGTFSGNTIGISGVLLSGSSQASALQVTSHGTGSHVTLIDDNNLYGYNENGILLRANDGSSTLNATLTRNTLANPGANVFAGIVIEPGAQSSDTNVICADVGGTGVENSFVGSGNGSFPLADFVSATSSSATLNMPGLAGGVGGVAAYIQGRNTGTPTVFADGNHGAAACSTPLKAARGQGISWDGYLLSYDEFDAVVEEALRRWASTELTADQANLLERVTFGIEDLPEGTLGKSRETHVVVDISGAGYGWFVDGSPKDQREFVVTAYKTTLFARPKEDSADRMDLLTVIMHEIGHVLGKEHATGQRELMTSTLDTGVRRVLGTSNTSAKKVRSTAGESRDLRSDRLDAQEHDLVDALAEMVSEDISNANALEAILTPVESPDGNLPVEVSNTSSGGIASGETVQVAIGTLGPGESIQITFEVTINDPLSPVNVADVCNQGTVSGDIFPDEVTDDPDTGIVDDPTCTPLPGATVGDFVWVDLNGNGIRDSGEPGRSGVIVELRAGNLVASTSTDIGGFYSFHDVAPGLYFIRFASQPGFVFTTQDVGADDAIDSDADPSSGDTDAFSVVSGEVNLTIDAGVLILAVVTGAVWDDLDADGARVGEPGIPGVTLNLLDSTAAIVGTEVTDAVGDYFFSDVFPGDYTVVVDDTTLPPGSQPTFDPDGIGTPHAAAVSLSSGDVVVGFSFGYSVVTFSVDDVTLAEGNAGTTIFTFTVTRTGGAATRETVDIETADDTATAGQDYTALTLQTMVFEVGVSSLTRDIDVQGDITVELDEEFLVNLSSASAGVITNAQGVGRILNDDCATVSISDVSEPESTTPFVFDVTLTLPVDVDVSVDLATANGTADDGGIDYFASVDPLTILAGNTEEVREITIVNDEVAEPDETFSVLLSNLQAGGRCVSFVDDQGLGTILNDDIVDLSLTKSDGDVTAEVGDTVTYTLSYNNLGNIDLTGVGITESVPAHSTFDAAASTTGWACPPPCVAENCSFDLGSVAGGASGSVDFAVTIGECGCSQSVPVGVESTSNTASIHDDGTHGPDRDPGNNTDGETTPIDAAPDLTITKDDGMELAEPGDTLVYSIEFSNVGTQDATGITVREVVPIGTTFNASDSSNGWSCSNGAPGGTVCTIGIVVLRVCDPAISVTFAVDVLDPIPAGFSQVENTVTVQDDGTNGPDQNPDDNSATDITVVNQPPVADANGPYEVDEGGSVVLDASASDDPDGDPLTFEWDFDGDGAFDDAVGEMPVFSAVGLDGPDTIIVEVLVSDDRGLSSTATAIIDVLNVAPTVTVEPAIQTIQYSDSIETIDITGDDVAQDDMFISIETDVDGGGFSAGLPSALSLTDNGCSIAGNINTCEWSIDGIANVPAGDYTIRVTVEDEDGGITEVDVLIEVIPEDVSISFDSNNTMAEEVTEDGGDSGPFSLTVVVSELVPDVSAAPGPAAGDITLAVVTLTLVPVGPGGSVAGSCSQSVAGVGYNAEITLTCDFDMVAVNTYAIVVNVSGGFYAGFAESVMVVFDPSLGFTTGGGWFFWPGSNDRTNFGYSMKFHRRSTKAKGNLLLIRHLPDGSILRIKSNALYGLAIGQDSDADGDFGWAAFSGKASFQEPGFDSAGNHVFTAYVEDHGTPGVDVDQFWMKLFDPDGMLILDLSMDEPATDNTQTIQGGNIVVPHRSGGNVRQGGRP